MKSGWHRRIQASFVVTFVVALTAIAPAAFAASIQIKQGGPGAGNNPQKNACQFEVEFSGFAAGAGTITATFQAPTPPGGGGAPFYTQPVILSGATTESVQVDLGPSIRASGVSPAVGGWHVRIDVVVGTDAKTHTVWVDGCWGDLRIQKSANPALPNSILVNQNGKFTLTATNLSGRTLPNVVVEDTIVAPLTYVSHTNTDCSFDTTTKKLTCTFASLAVGDTETIEITVTSATAGTHPNTATIRSPALDTDTSNDSASASMKFDPVPTPILGITKTPANASVRQGSNHTFTIKVSNTGDADANDVNVTDVLPSGLTLVAVTWPSGSPSSCTTTTLTCNIGTIVKTNGEKTITVEVTGTTLGSHTNKARIGTNGPEATAVLNVTAPDLKVTKDSNKAEILKGGEQVTFTIDVENIGDADANSVSFTDTLPAGLNLVSVTWPGSADSSCTTSTLTCSDIGTIAPGAANKKTVTVVATGAATGTHINSASASTTGDSTNANNTDTAQVKVTMFDLNVVKTRLSASPIKVGQQASFSLTVTNTGDADATNVVLTDELPGGLAFDSATPNSANCTYNSTTHDVTCNLGTLAKNGGTTTVTLFTTATFLGLQENVATVAPTDETPANNTSRASVQVDTTFIPPPPASADLSITKNDAADPVLAGDNITYTVSVKNNGPDAATDVTVTDALPAGLGFVSATPSAGTCNAASPISCALGTIASGQTVTITVVASTSATTPGTVVNSATASSPTTDPNTGNNQDSETTTVVQPLPPEKGRIVVEKRTLPAGATASFQFTGDAAGSLRDGETLVFEVDAGTYTSTESPKNNWTLTDVACDDGDSSGSVGAATATFRVAEGETVKCTFTSTRDEVLPKPPIENPSDPDPEDPEDPEVPEQRDRVKGTVLPFTGGPLTGMINLALLSLLSGATLVLGVRRGTREDPWRRP